MQQIVRKSQPIFRDDTQAAEHKMVTRALLCFALVSTGMIGGALGAGADNASAADDCMTESNLVPPKGSRWYYHIDRATNRKCWYTALASAPAAPCPARAAVRAKTVQAVRASKHERSESEQAALFLEFLRWKEQQSAANSRGAAPSQEATRR
jgi:hypothetical protein